MRIRCNNYDITGQTGDITWTNTIAELATKLTFSIPKIDAKYTNLYYPQLGNPVGLDKDINAEGRFFYGTIIEIADGDMYVNKYTAVDKGWELNKTRLDIQFNDSTFENAIREVAGHIDTLIGCVGTFSETYLDKTKAEILDDILEKLQERNGYVYNYDMTPNGLRVYRLGDLHANPKFTLTPNKTWQGTTYYDSAVFKGEITHTTSIEEEFKEPYSCTIIDDIDGYIRAGEEIVIDNAKWIIESAEHSIKDDWQIVKLDLRRA